VSLDSTIEILGEDGIIGAKTGSHFGNGIFNLATAWQAPSGDTIIAVTLKSASNAARYDDMRAILAALPRDFPELAVPDPGAAEVVTACPEGRQKPAASR
jgi:D-alanyl-D-alanine carboxypeptidase (penicillin-binding protein 5/6)